MKKHLTEVTSLLFPEKSGLSIYGTTSKKPVSQLLFVELIHIYNQN